MRTDWRLIAAVAVGGALGSVARYLLGAFIQDRVSIGLPVGTLVINVVGSLLLGFFMAIGLETTAITPEIRFFLTTGFCGGFTTFSTFSYETYRLIEDAEYGTASVYAVGSVVLSVLACALGIGAARRLVSGRTRTARADQT
jgi:fluoride exporter